MAQESALSGQQEKVSKETVREMARLAGLPIPEDRLEDVAAAFNALWPAIDRMMALELDELEPAPVLPPRQEL